MPERLAEVVLSQLRNSYRVSIGHTRYAHTDGSHRWLITARDANGQAWSAHGEDYYEAACALAQLMGFELEDG